MAAPHGPPVPSSWISTSADICLCLTPSPWPRGSRVPVPPQRLLRSKELSICLSCRLLAQSSCLSQTLSPKWVLWALPFQSQSLYSELSERGHIWNLGATGEAEGLSWGG